MECTEDERIKAQIVAAHAAYVMEKALSSVFDVERKKMFGADKRAGKAESIYIKKKGGGAYKLTLGLLSSSKPAVDFIEGIEDIAMKGRLYEVVSFLIYCARAVFIPIQSTARYIQSSKGLKLSDLAVVYDCNDHVVKFVYMAPEQIKRQQLSNQLADLLSNFSQKAATPDWQDKWKAINAQLAVVEAGINDDRIEEKEKQINDYLKCNACSIGVAIETVDSIDSARVMH